MLSDVASRSLRSHYAIVKLTFMVCCVLGIFLFRVLNVTVHYIIINVNKENEETEVGRTRG